MFAVVFEVQPDPDRFDAYLDIAKGLRPQLEEIVGFDENVRYKSLTRPGWLLSLSTWADEKALVRWRTREHHHLAQARGRDEILLDYHLRVGQVVRGAGPGWAPGNSVLQKQERFDATEAGEARVLVLVDGLRVEGGDGGQQQEQEQGQEQGQGAQELAARLGLHMDMPPAGLVAWDVMDAVLSPGDRILLSSWSTEEAAALFCVQVPAAYRSRNIRVIRDYGKYDRREAPQFYKDAQGRETVH